MNPPTELQHHSPPPPPSAPGAGMPPPTLQTSSLAVISLICGIVSWVLLPVLGSLAAVITGHLARKEIRNAPQRLTGDGMAVAGLVLGYLSLALALAGLLFVFLVLGGVAFLGWQGS